MIKKYLFFFLLLGGIYTLKSNVLPLDSLKYVNEISLTHFSTYAYSSNKENILPSKFYTRSEFNNLKAQLTSKVLWQKFELSNTFGDTLFVYSKSRVAKMELFKYQNGKLTSIGRTGFANKLKDASIKGSYHAIHFPNYGQGEYLVKLSSERYRLNVPELYIGRYLYKINEIENRGIISLLVAGFQICLVIICLLFFVVKVFRDYPKLLIYFILIGFFDSLYFLVRYHIIILETDFLQYTNSQVWNIIGDLNIIFYYIFFIHFYNIPKKSFFYYIIQIGILFWVVQISVELSDFTTPSLIYLAKNYLNYASVVDFIIMSTIVVFVIKNRWNERFYQIGSIGLLVMWLSSLEIAFPHLFLSSDWTITDFFTFSFMQLSSIINVFAVVAAFIYDYTIKEKERLKMKSVLVQQEVEKMALIQKERERISHDMHDDLGAGISALKLQSEFLKKRIKDPEIKNDVEDLIKTTHDINSSMREMLWSLNSKKDTLEDLVNYIIQYGEQFFAKSNIRFSSNIFSPIKDYSIDVSMRRNIFLCLKEAFNNAYKHSGAHEVCINFSIEENLLLIRYVDDGIGIGEVDLRGNGLRNMKLRMEECLGEFKIISSKEGLTLIFTIPLY